MTIKKQLISQLTEIVKEADIDVTPSVDYPTDPRHGDYTTNVAFVAFKKYQGASIKYKGITSPMELAEEISEELRIKNKELSFFEKVEVAKPGFINFFLSEKALIKEISENNIPQIGTGKKVIVEYSSPNIAKPFTIGHLRSTIIGDAIANLLHAVGYEVFRDNHIGDWGTQFGKQIYAIKAWGNEEEIEKSDRPVKELVALYVKFHEEAEKDPSLEDKAREWFKKLEDGDQEARRLWKKCIDWSWKEFNVIYEQLGVSFTENDGRGYGEAFFEDKMGEIIEELKAKNLLSEGKEGAKIVEFPEETKLPNLMILKKDGATLYSTRDLATDKFRIGHYGEDITIINEVGAEQALYFQQLYKLEEMLGWFKPGQRFHVKHGLYRFKEGKMSTRKGNVIWLEDVLEEANRKAHILMTKSHDIKWEDTHVETKSKDKTPTLKESEIINNSPLIAIGALKWNDLKRDPKLDINFDWDEMLTMQGNSGPYMQYAYVRTKSVLEKGKGESFDFAQDKSVKGEEKKENVLYPLPFTLHPEERDILRLVARFPEIVEEAALRYAPHLLCTYLFNLAQAFNLFYQKQPILKAEGESREFRLQLTAQTGKVIKEGLHLLGITTPERM